MKIKKLQPDELPRIRRLGRLFAEEVHLFSGYVPEKFESVWRPLMEAGLADVFYAEDGFGELVGFLGASYVGDLYSGVAAAQAQFWFAAPDYRKGSLVVRLFNAWESEAESRGTQKYFAGYKAGINEAGMRGFLERRGYFLGEFMFWKNKETV